MGENVNACVSQGEGDALEDDRVTLRKQMPPVPRHDANRCTGSLVQEESGKQ